MKLPVLKTLECGILYRSGAAEIRKEGEQVSLSFSSEEPVERWFGTEILDHGSESVRLKRLNTGGPLLVDHDPKDLVGVIQSAGVTGKKGRAAIKFGRSARAQEVAQDVKDEIRVNTSVGYRIHEMVLESETDDVPTYRVVDWEPLEVSLVSVPADITVGVGRAEDRSQLNSVVVRGMTAVNQTGRNFKMNKCKTCGAELSADGSCQRCEQREEKGEQFRTKEILCIGEKFHYRDLAIEALQKGTSVEDFRKEVLGMIGRDPSNKPISSNMRDLAAEKPFRFFGEQLQAVANVERRKVVDPRLDHLQRVASGLGEAIPSDAGFLVQTDFSLALLEKVNEESPLIAGCKKIPISSGANAVDLPIVDETSRATGSRWGGIQVYRVEEGEGGTPKKPKLGNISVKLEKLLGVCYASDEVIADAALLQTIVEDGFKDEMNFVLGDEIVRGSGVGQCLGILNAPALVTVSKETGQAADTVIYENLLKIFSRMPGRLRSKAAWYYNQEIEPQLFTLGLTLGMGGAPVWLPPAGGASATPYSSLFGRPMIPIEQASALGDKGDIIFANLGEYLLIEKGGMIPAWSMHVRFLNDENTFRITWRVIGTPAWKAPLTPYKGAAQLSPFVTLADRA